MFEEKLITKVDEVLNPQPSATVRKLLVDLERSFPRQWHGGDAFRSQIFNAMSMSFPIGEQYFMDTIRANLVRLPDGQQQKFAQQIRLFIGQEASHRRLHALYNEHLERQGFVNHYARWGIKRIERSRRWQDINNLAVTCAYEHITAVLSHGVLSYQNWFLGAHDQLKMLWCWHAAEEIEHKTVAYNLYLALGGGHGKRRRWFTYVLFNFIIETLGQTINNLWHTKSLLKIGTWISAGHFLFGKEGMVRRSLKPMLAYYRHDFHPAQQGDDLLSHDWLTENKQHWHAVSPVIVKGN